MASTPSWFFRPTVDDADTHGSSTSYLVTVFTNLEVYSDHGGPTDGQARIVWLQWPRAGIQGCDVEGQRACLPAWASQQRRCEYC